MKKVNKKGFMLAELLAVTVVILVIFTSIFVNFYPLIGEYENRITYNDINSVYANYYLKILLLKHFNANKTVERTILNNININKYQVLVKNSSCINNYSFGSFNCNSIVTAFGIEEAILTSFDPESVTINELDISDRFKKYVSSLPSYASTGGNIYRIIIKTKDGYATDQFYSKMCNDKTYSDWSDWSIKSCNGATDVCESKTIYLNCSETTMNPGNCETNPLCYYNGTNYRVCNKCISTSNNCNSTNVYRSRELITTKVDEDNWSCYRSA